MMRWFIPWEPSAAFICVITATILFYLRGCKILKPHLQNRILFWSGIAVFYISCHTQFDYYAEHQFFIGRIQHTLLHHVGPMLIAFSSPWAVLYEGMPRQLTARLQSLPMRLLIQPAVSVILFSFLILIWLIPPVHNITMIDWRIYRLMNWSMAINGLVFWGTAIDKKSPFSPGARIGMMLAVIPPQIVAGAILFFTPHILYPLYDICGRAFGSVDPLADQQIGGQILWVGAAMMSAIGIIAVIHRDWMKEERMPCPPPCARP